MRARDVTQLQIREERRCLKNSISLGIDRMNFAGYHSGTFRTANPLMTMTSLLNSHLPGMPESIRPRYPFLSRRVGGTSILSNMSAF